MDRETSSTLVYNWTSVHHYLIADLSKFSHVILCCLKYWQDSLPLFLSRFTNVLYADCRVSVWKWSATDFIHTVCEFTKFTQTLPLSVSPCTNSLIGDVKRFVIPLTSYLIFRDWKSLQFSVSRVNFVECSLYTLRETDSQMCFYKCRMTWFS